MHAISCGHMILMHFSGCGLAMLHGACTLSVVVSYMMLMYLLSVVSSYCQRWKNAINWVCTEEVTYGGYYDQHAFTWNFTIWVYRRISLMFSPVRPHFVTGLDLCYRSGDMHL